MSINTANRVSIDAEVVSFPTSIVQQAITEAIAKNLGMVSFLVVNGICVGTTTVDAAPAPSFRVVETPAPVTATDISSDRQQQTQPFEPAADLSTNLTPENIYNIIAANDQITVTAIGDILGLKRDSYTYRSTVKRILGKLVSNGMVVGSNTYSVVNDAEKTFAMPTHVVRKPYKMRVSAENIVHIMRNGTPMDITKICDEMRIPRNGIGDRMRVGTIIRKDLIRLGLVQIIEEKNNGKSTYALSQNNI